MIGIGNAFRGDDAAGRRRRRAPAPARARGRRGRLRASEEPSRLIEAWEGADRVAPRRHGRVGRAARDAASLRRERRAASPRARFRSSTHAFGIARRRSSSPARSAGCRAASVVYGIEGGSVRGRRSALTPAVEAAVAARSSRTCWPTWRRSDARARADGGPDARDRGRRPRGRRDARDARRGAPRRALALHAGALPRALRRRLARHARRGRRGRRGARRRPRRPARDGRRARERRGRGARAVETG